MLIKNRIMTKTVTLSGKYNGLYGTDGHNIYHKVVVPELIKGTKDDYRLIEVWHIVHYGSYELGAAFNALK